MAKAMEQRGFTTAELGARAGRRLRRLLLVWQDARAGLLNYLGTIPKAAAPQPLS